MLIFRYDDYSAAPRIDVGIDESLFGMFRTHKVPLTVGVTPHMVADVHDADCQSFAILGDDERRLRLLRQGLDLGWELALHGLTHRRSAVRDYTEFAMVSRRVQSSRIRQGREELQKWLPGTPLSVFIPPWNSYDQITVEVAADQGFEVLCAGPTARPGVRSGLRIVPSAITIDDLLNYDRLLSVRQLLKDLGRSALVVTLHEYEFRTDNGPDRDRVAALEAILSQLAGEGVQVGTVSKANPIACDLADRSDLHSSLAMIRKLRGPAGLRLSSRIAGMKAGSAQQVARKALRAVALASSSLESSKRAVRDSLRPIRRSLTQARAITAARFRRGPSYRCSFCNYEGSFGLIGERTNGRCLRCGSLERHRFIAATVGPLLKQRTQRRRALMLAPDPLLAMLRSAFDCTLTGDIAAKNVDVTFDLQRLPFRDKTLDLVLAIHVLDEIEDDVLALRECGRVLADGGWLIAPVPIHKEDKTLELDERRADGKVRLAGRDYFDRITAAGFRLTKAFEPLDPAFSDLHRLQNIRTPWCVADTEGVVVFEKPTSTT